ncbi:MAG: hypothetical protein CMK32_02550 [Porticoccaceae bacterium]|nr:hypothetical protein [Porticoccaceae bacterium]
MNPNPLDQLRDVHLPPPPGWWPPAPGWWLLAALIIILMVAGALRWRRRRVQTRHRRMAIQALSTLEAQNSEQWLTDLFNLVRRLCRAEDPLSPVLSEGNDQLLDRLDEHSKGALGRDLERHGTSLASLRQNVYQATPQTLSEPQRRVLVQHVRRYLKQTGGKGQC